MQSSDHLLSFACVDDVPTACAYLISKGYILEPADTVEFVHPDTGMEASVRTNKDNQTTIIYYDRWA